MRTPMKPCRAVCELTDEEDEAFTVAIDHHQGARDERVSRQSVLRKMIATFCQKEGVRFPAPSPKGRRPRRAAAPPASF